MIAAIFSFNTQFTLLNMSVFLFWTVYTMVQLLSVKPFNTRKQNILELTNESTVWFCTYLCLCFLDPKNSQYFIKVMGFVFIGICSLNILYNVTLVALEAL